MTTEAGRAELRALLAAGTPGPWIRTSLREGGGYVRRELGAVVADMRYRNGANDAALIVAMRNALPGLLDELDRLTRPTEDDEYPVTPSTKARAHERAHRP